MMKKALSLALALILCLCLAAPAFAADSDFVIENGVLTKYNGPGGDVVIPSGVSSIGDSVFVFCDSLTSVVIPNGVTSIGDLAFHYCKSLTSVTIPDSVTSIGDGAFYFCTSLTSVTIPDSVTSIGNSAFASCDNLTAIQVAANNQRYCSVDGVVFSKDMKTLAACPGRKQGTYNIPTSVTRIEEFAFGGCANLTGVTIPSSVTSIGEGAFMRCTGLTGVTIPNSVTSIGDGAFLGCEGLTSVNIPNSVTSIGEGAFWSCQCLTGVTIPSSVTSIGDYAFDLCFSLTDVNIPDSVTSIGSSAFHNCKSLISVTIPNGVTSIGEDAFNDCSNLISVTISGSVTSISRATFFNCIRLTSVTIPDSVTGIGAYAFDRCFSLTDIYYGGTEAQWKAVTIGEANDEFLGAVIHYNSAAPDTSSQSETASPTNDKLTVNGVLQTPAVYKIGGSNYFKIRDLAAMLSGTEKQFDVGYDGALNSVTITTGKSYSKPDTYLIGALGGNQPAALSNDTIYINGQKIDVTVYKIGGSNYFKLRDLGKALDFYVGWTARDGVFIDTSKPYSE